MRVKYVEGESVLVQREVDASWEPAAYVQKSAWRGYHCVTLQSNRYINMTNGETTTENHPHAHATKRLSVPTRRLQKLP